MEIKLLTVGEYFKFDTAVSPIRQCTVRRALPVALLNHMFV